jgi:catechol 2,3-dioxygenase-like lactoylglutathione lyase family enzyme
MAKKRATKSVTKTATKRSEADAPQIFRVTLQVSDLERAVAFYSELLGAAGRRIHGARHYYDCGPVILAVLDPSAGKIRARPMADHVYFSVKDLDAIHARAKKLACLSDEDVHGESGGEIAVRPWGERSFYAEDPFGNPLCFVDGKTLFRG